MGNRSQSCRALTVVAQLVVAAYACRGAAPDPQATGDLSMATPTEDVSGAENGQTGSTEPPDCLPGVPIEVSKEGPCGVDLEAWTLPIGRAELARATCKHVTDSLPVCECWLHRTRLPGDERAWPEGRPEVVTYPGARQSWCSEFARTPSGCLYCGSEFPGCSIDDPHSCDAVCADMASRYDAELQKAFSASLRRLSCGDDYTCEFVTEIEGLCYGRNPQRPPLAAFDCALSDAQILARKAEPDTLCPEPAPVACRTASDCPRGLACDDAGACVPCRGICHDATGQCEHCADGELCVEQACVPQANVECVTFSDCEPPSQCVLTGMDAAAGRGNAQTRSLCRVVGDPDCPQCAPSSP